MKQVIDVVHIVVNDMMVYKYGRFQKYVVYQSYRIIDLMRTLSQR